MTMTNTEQNSLFQAMKSIDQVMLVRTQDGVNEYVLCRLVPLKTFTPTEAATFAAIYSVTIASP